MRKTKEELEAIKKKYKVDRLWSWSKINTYRNSPYEYYLKYIKRAKEDRQDCIYTVAGGMAHDIMERLYLGKIAYEDMDDAFEDAWMTASIAELKFDRNDSEKNERISDKYYRNLKHFFTNHEKLTYKTEIERFIAIVVGNNVLQGYIDLCFKDDDGCFNIIDFKTSSIYKGEKALNECGQLVVYAIGLHQMGVPFGKIKIGWNFLKYVKIDCMQANGNWTTREIDRCEIGNKLQTSVKMWLKKTGYDEQIDEYLNLLSETNNIKCLPKEVQEKYQIHDCVVYVDLTEELMIKWLDEIANTIREIEEKEEQYEVKKVVDEYEAEKIFFDSPEQVEKQSYYFSTLCAYSPNIHKPYKLYLDERERIKNGENLFVGVGEIVSETENNDMSWLDQL